MIYKIKDSNGQALTCFSKVLTFNSLGAAEKYLQDLYGNFGDRIFRTRFTNVFLITETGNELHITDKE